MFFLLISCMKTKANSHLIFPSWMHTEHLLPTYANTAPLTSSKVDEDFFPMADVVLLGVSQVSS